MSASDGADGRSSANPRPATDLVRGLLPSGLTPVQVRQVQRFRLIDCGDHVEWSDGKKVKRWRLADQAGADPSLPILAGVSRMYSGSAVFPLQSVRAIYCEPSGAFLGDVSAPRMWIRNLAEQCYPPGVYEPLTARGVTLADESLVTVERVERAHPGLNRSRMMSFYRRHAFLVILAVFMLVIAIAEIYTFARG